MCLLPSQLISNRDFIKPNQGNASFSGAQMYAGVPLAGAMPETLPPFYQSLDCNLGSTKPVMNKADSGISNIVDQRKRPGDSINQFDDFVVPQKRNRISMLPSFLDQELIFQAQQQQSEIDRFLAQHAEKVRLELEDQRRVLMSAFQEIFTKKLKEKDEEIQRMRKVNWVLLERVKSLSAENQIWRDLAQNNEATANTLRSNLEQVLAHAGEDSDAESSCGSNDLGRCTLAEEAKGVKDTAVVSGGQRMCRKCGARESRVLSLPCRHLCLCTACASSLRDCPVCNSVMNATVHVNFS